MCRPREVQIEYRRHLDSYLQWERKETERQAQVITKFRYKEPKGFRVPPWLAALAVLGILGALVWVFRAVVLK